jgi:hypothetical protein
MQQVEPERNFAEILLALPRAFTFDYIFQSPLALQALIQVLEKPEAPGIAPGVRAAAAIVLSKAAVQHYAAPALAIAALQAINAGVRSDEGALDKILAKAPTSALLDGFQKSDMATQALLWPILSVRSDFGRAVSNNLAALQSLIVAVAPDTLEKTLKESGVPLWTAYLEMVVLHHPDKMPPADPARFLSNLLDQAIDPQAFDAGLRQLVTLRPSRLTLGLGAKTGLLEALDDPARRALANDFITRFSVTLGAMNSPHAPRSPALLAAT